MFPDVGDVAWIELDPVLGTEQAGRRPGLILTDHGYNVRSGRALICPITRSRREWTFHVPIPSGLRVEGMIMVDQIRVVDRTRRIFEYIDHLPPDVVSEVRGRLAVLVGLTNPTSPEGRLA